ncbi:hypothetical protein NMY22_g7641 [Coprinellus aureogranulatus]|nr:hypothetical protein NMY22_g7641 [Coprinellus aureogranulatus]
MILQVIGQGEECIESDNEQNALVTASTPRGDLNTLNEGERSDVGLKITAPQTEFNERSRMLTLERSPMRDASQIIIGVPSQVTSLPRQPGDSPGYRRSGWALGRESCDSVIGKRDQYGFVTKKEGERRTGGQTITQRCAKVKNERKAKADELREHDVRNGNSAMGPPLQELYGWTGGNRVSFGWGSSGMENPRRSALRDEEARGGVQYKLKTGQTESVKLDVWTSGLACSAFVPTESPSHLHGRRRLLGCPSSLKFQPDSQNGLWNTVVTRSRSHSTPYQHIVFAQPTLSSSSLVRSGSYPPPSHFVLKLPSSPLSACAHSPVVPQTPKSNYASSSTPAARFPSPPIAHSHPGPQFLIPLPPNNAHIRQPPTSVNGARGTSIREFETSHLVHLLAHKSPLKVSPSQTDIPPLPIPTAFVPDFHPPHRLRLVLASAPRNHGLRTPTSNPRIPTPPAITRLLPVWPLLILAFPASKPVLPCNANLTRLMKLFYLRTSLVYYQLQPRTKGGTTLGRRSKRRGRMKGQPVSEYFVGQVKVDFAPSTNINSDEVLSGYLRD